MLDILLATQNLPFTIAITVALLIGVIEIIALAVGAGGLIDGLTADMDVSADIDGFSFLDYLCIGRIPFLMWLVVFLLSFGAIGIIFQSIFGLSPFIASLIVLVISVFPTRNISLLLQRIMPKDETTAINSDNFIGYTATIVIGEARRNYPAQAKFTDEYKQTHYVMVEPLIDEETLKVGESITLYEKQGNIFTATKNI